MNGYNDFVNNCELSDFEKLDGTGESGFTLNTTNHTAPYDGIISIYHGSVRTIFINDVTRFAMNNGGVAFVKKGESVRINDSINYSDSINNARWYKKRDYTGR